MPSECEDFGAGRLDRGFVLEFGWVSVSILLFVGVVNLLVDPFNRFGMNRLGVFISAEREYKSTAVMQIPHNALLLGNSKPAMIDPLKIKGWKFFNGAFSGGLPEEIGAFVEAYAHKQDLVVLALDFGMFNETLAPFTQATFVRRFHDDVADYLLNLKAFGYSIKTLIYAMRGAEPRIFEAGNTNPFWTNQTEAAFPKVYHAGAHAVLREKALVDFRFSEARMEELVFIREILAERQIPLIVFLNPENAGVKKIIFEMGLGPQFEDWRKELTRMFPNLIDLTNSEFTGDEFYYRHDPIHYYPDTGAQFLNDRVLREVTAEVLSNDASR